MQKSNKQLEISDIEPYLEAVPGLRHKQRLREHNSTIKLNVSTHRLSHASPKSQPEPHQQSHFPHSRSSSIFSGVFPEALAPFINGFFK